MFFQIDTISMKQGEMERNEEEIRKQACLFGKSKKELTKYQQKMNEVAGDLCVKEPHLLSSKGKLIEIARTKLHESGYIYKKGKSRSKVINPPMENQSTREKVDKEEREHRISSLTEQLGDIQKHISVKEKRMEQAHGIQNFKLCDQLSTEVLLLKEKRRELEAALRVLKSKQKKSEKYFVQKTQKDVNSFDLEMAPTEGDSNFL